MSGPWWHHAVIYQLYVLSFRDANADGYGDLEIEESGLIDGCSRMGVIWRVILPLAAPALAAVSLYVFMIAWNEFLYALLFLTQDRELWTLPLGLQQLDSREVPRTVLMAGAVIISLPVVVIFLLAERFLTEGLTAGSVKG
jgi:multiple sugar transport system permease protein